MSLPIPNTGLISPGRGRSTLVGDVCEGKYEFW